MRSDSVAWTLSFTTAVLLAVPTAALGSQSTKIPNETQSSDLTQPLGADCIPRWHAALSSLAELGHPEAENGHFEQLELFDSALALLSAAPVSSITGVTKLRDAVVNKQGQLRSDALSNFPKIMKLRSCPVFGQYELLKRSILSVQPLKITSSRRVALQEQLVRFLQAEPSSGVELALRISLAELACDHGFFRKGLGAEFSKLHQEFKPELATVFNKANWNTALQSAKAAGSFESVKDPQLRREILRTTFIDEAKLVSQFREKFRKLLDSSS